MWTMTRWTAIPESVKLESGAPPLCLIAPVVRRIAPGAPPLHTLEIEAAVAQLVWSRWARNPSQSAAPAMGGCSVRAAGVRPAPAVTMAAA